MTAATGFWLAGRPLILASGSAARRDLLEAVFIPHRVVPATIDERAVEQPLRDAGASPAGIAAHLAEAKAIATSVRLPGDLVLGADQTLALGDRIFTKAADTATARQTLEALAGHTHVLHSAWVLARGGMVLAAGLSEARMTMRSLDAAFLDAYVEKEGAALCSSVGAYRLEGTGFHLFEAIEGDHSTILGLPLLPVLAALRQHGYLLS